MSDSSNLTGGFGAITGAAALLISILAYRRVSAMKALDLRLELNKAFDKLDIVLSGIEDYLDLARRSRINVLAATVGAKSGAALSFDQSFENDKLRLRSLLSSQPQRMTSYESLSPTELETLLTSVNSLHAQLFELRAKYQKIFDADDTRRQEIRSHYPR